MFHHFEADMQPRDTAFFLSLSQNLGTLAWLRTWWPVTWATPTIRLTELKIMGMSFAYRLGSSMGSPSLEGETDRSSRQYPMIGMAHLWESMNKGRWFCLNAGTATINSPHPDLIPHFVASFRTMGGDVQGLCCRYYSTEILLLHHCITGDVDNKVRG